MKIFSLTLFTITTSVLMIQAINVQDYLQKNNRNISFSTSSVRFPRGTVVMIASKEMDNWFNINGHGLGEYAGWYICDGRNGTPDLRGRFVVGRDPFNHASVYGNIGMTGGLEKVKLTVDEMPSHSHNFQGQSSNDGAHSHHYQDVTYADGCDLPVPTYRGIRSGTPHNRACQIGRTTQASGTHAHTMSGPTSYIGGNKPHENRPPYYVIAYIIYVGP